MPREKDEWLLCDAPRGGGWCSGRIGFVQDTDGRRLLLVLPGWQRDRARVYHEPPHALDRREHGHQPRPLPGTLSGMKRSRGKSWKAAWFDPSPRGGLVKLRCPDCNVVHELTASELRVEPIAPISMITEQEHKAP